MYPPDIYDLEAVFGEAEAYFYRPENNQFLRTLLLTFADVLPAILIHLSVR